MSYQISDFTGQLDLVAARHYANPNRAAELNAVAAALATDPSTHDTTITTAPTGLQLGAAGNSRFTDDVLQVVNRGKGGNLTPLAMGNAITAELSRIFPPAMTTLPAISGTVTIGSTLNVTNGNWTYAPTSYAYQWLRDGANIVGARSASYTLAAADSTHSIACQVTATNAAGSTPATANAVGPVP